MKRKTTKQSKWQIYSFVYLVVILMSSLIPGQDEAQATSERGYSREEPFLAIHFQLSEQEAGNFSSGISASQALESCDKSQGWSVAGCRMLRVAQATLERENSSFPQGNLELRVFKQGDLDASVVNSLPPSVCALIDTPYLKAPKKLLPLITHNKIPLISTHFSTWQATDSTPYLFHLRVSPEIAKQAISHFVGSKFAWQNYYQLTNEETLSCSGVKCTSSSIQEFKQAIQLDQSKIDFLFFQGDTCRQQGSPTCPNPRSSLPVAGSDEFLTLFSLKNSDKLPLGSLAYSGFYQNSIHQGVQEFVSRIGDEKLASWETAMMYDAVRLIFHSLKAGGIQECTPLNRHKIRDQLLATRNFTAASSSINAAQFLHSRIQLDFMDSEGNLLKQQFYDNKKSLISSRFFDSQTVEITPAIFPRKPRFAIINLRTPSWSPVGEGDSRKAQPYSLLLDLQKNPILMPSLIWRINFQNFVTADLKLQILPALEGSKTRILQQFQQQLLSRLIPEISCQGSKQTGCSKPVKPFSFDKKIQQQIEDSCRLSPEQKLSQIPFYSPSPGSVTTDRLSCTLGEELYQQWKQKVLDQSPSELKVEFLDQQGKVYDSLFLELGEQNYHQYLYDKLGNELSESLFDSQGQKLYYLYFQKPIYEVKIQPCFSKNSPSTIYCNQPQGIPREIFFAGKTRAAPFDQSGRGVEGKFFFFYPRGTSKALPYLYAVRKQSLPAEMGFLEYVSLLRKNEPWQQWPSAFYQILRKHQSRENYCQDLSCTFREWIQEEHPLLEFHLIDYFRLPSRNQ